MITPESLGLFVAAGLLLNLTPGPDVLYIVSQSLRGGLRPGMVAALGITAGCFVHVAAAALGLGALLMASSSAFNTLKWVGAAYLLWSGIRLLRNSAASGAQVMGAEALGQPPVPLKVVFLRGFLTNVLNPKVALFFLAFVPQFIPADSPDPAALFVALGCLFNLNGLVVCMAWALAAAWLVKHARMVQRGMHWLDRMAGALFVGFGLRLAWSDMPAR